MPIMSALGKKRTWRPLTWLSSPPPHDTPTHSAPRAHAYDSLKLRRSFDAQKETKRPLLAGVIGIEPVSIIFRIERGLVSLTCDNR